MYLKIITDNPKLKDLNIHKDKMYEVEEVIQDCYKIKVPKKQKGKFNFALVNDVDGILVNNQ